MGVWLGGWVFDHTGSYNTVWYMTIGLSLFAALINLPVREQGIQRVPVAA
jgi:cyanate permease